jgi:GH15 family glucan-1,4-alpha-glucosidase
MAWVAFDRAVRACEEFGREGPVDRWRELRQEIHDEVSLRAWSDEKQSFTQSFDSTDLDASELLLPAVGFLPATDPRCISTVAAIERELSSGGLIMRYQPRGDGAVDGIASDEGVFLPCSFWLADALALQGETDRARELFERLLDLRSELGLLSEEYDPVANRQLGNFPQAFTHLALINTAFVLREGRTLREGLPGTPLSVSPRPRPRSERRPRP